MLHQGNPLPEVSSDIAIWPWLFQKINNSQRGGPVGYFQEETRRVTFVELQAQATHLATILSVEYGLRPQHNITITAPSCLEYTVAFFAALRLGAQITALAPETSIEDLKYFLKTAKSQFIFAGVSSYSNAREASEAVGMPRENVIVIDAADNGRATFEKLVQQGDALGEHRQVPAWTIPEKQSSKDICAFLSFTSGTTGLPKGVMISHHNVISQLNQVRLWTRRGSPMRILAVLPFYHITGLIHLLQLPILLNQEVILMSKFSLSTLQRTIKRFRCEELWLVPPILIRLANDPQADLGSLATVKQINTGAAPLAPDLVAKLTSLLPYIGIRQAWGMTESCSCLTLTPPEHQTWENAHTVGKIVPGTQIKVVAVEDGSVVGVGGVGELWAKGPQVAMGYLENAEANASTFDVEGFLHTGDLGSVDSEGFVTIHDRIKELVKVNGHGVAPAELESLLIGHPKVADVAVVGVPHPNTGETLKAFVVVRKEDFKIPETKKEIQKYVQSRKVRYKWLGGGVDLVDEIPKSASGKILRRVLKEQEKKKSLSKSHL